MDGTQHLKRQIEFALLLWFEMFEERRKTMTPENWRSLVRNTELGIIGNPPQYIGEDLFSTEELGKMAKELFMQFLKEHKEVEEEYEFPVG